MNLVFSTPKGELIFKSHLIETTSTSPSSSSSSTRPKFVSLKIRNKGTRIFGCVINSIRHPSGNNRFSLASTSFCRSQN
ncbi:hypothetical protein QR98_0071320 [Sarcoptes scabiei]|uniref:Uncharacterized protein n=1 Tax=Sarcoptes scabiei TaxID=52283 RepID=A0A132ADT6_SARSC|nr:hypothetical protein QR98_0071320 [Sarcoptes scabiei]